MLNLKSGNKSGNKFRNDRKRFMRLMFIFVLSLVLGGSQGIVFGGSAARLEKCFRNFFSDKKVELLERQKAIIDADKRVKIINL